MKKLTKILFRYIRFHIIVILFTHIYTSSQHKNLQYMKENVSWFEIVGILTLQCQLYNSL